MKRLLLFALCSLLFYSSIFATTIVVKTGEGGNFFSPAYFTINPGDTIKWVWKAGHHNTSSYSFPGGATGWYSNLNNVDSEFMYVPTVSGLYNYTCTHHSAMDGSFFVSGCTYPEKPVITATWQKSPCAGGATILLKTKVQSGVSYQWFKDGFLLSGMDNDSIIVSASGSYKVMVNRCGMDSISVPFFVAKYPLPSPSFSSTATGLHYTFTNTTSSIPGYIFRWRFGDSSADKTAINSDHDYATNGIYKVTLFIRDSLGNCIDSVEKSVNTELDIDEISKSERISVFPNPTTRFLNISTPELCSIQLSDFFGRTLLSSKNEANQFELDVNNLSPGVYLLHIGCADGTTVNKRVVISH